MMQMTDIQPIEDWAELEREIASRFTVNAHVYNAQGQPFTGHANYDNRLCSALRETKAAAVGVCAVINQAMGHEVRETRQAATTDCDVGMLVVCVPVFVDGDLVGMVGGCGGFADEAEPELFLLEKMAGLSEERVAGLCQGMRKWTSADVREMREFIEGRVAGIVAGFQARRRA